MPRYYFHVFHDIEAIDEEGIELPDLDAAREQAMEAARELACEAIHQGHLNLDHRIEVEDERRERVLSISYREAFTLKGEQAQPRMPE